MPCDLRDPGWGDPWFLHGAVLLLSPAGMVLCFLLFPPFLCLRPYHDEMTQCCHLLHESANELVASHFFVRWFLCGFCVVLVLCFCFVCFVVDDDGLLDYVPVLHQFSFVALNSRRPRVLIRNYCFCIAIERVKRPGGSHEGVGREKNC